MGTSCNTAKDWRKDGFNFLAPLRLDSPIDECFSHADAAGKCARD